MRNSISFRLFGKYALFTDPLSKGGEKYSYMLPTYQALVGICESIYWKPTFMWIVDSVRVISPIRTQPKNIRPIKYGGGNELAIYTYLVNVEYQVTAHFEWNLLRTDLENDRNENKHHNIAKRMVEKGGRSDIFLGTRECQGYIEPCEFQSGEGAYDNYGQMQFGIMFHGFDYPSITGNNVLSARLWRPVMDNGIVTFPSHMNNDDDIFIRRKLREATTTDVRTCGLDDDVLKREMGWQE